jgi:hypothetical protein
MPSSVSPERGWFDRFAERVSRTVSKGWFFSVCVLMIVLWAPSYPLWGNGDTYQLVVNTGTTIVTFLLVALLQNSQQRADQAAQHKLNAISAGLNAIADGVAELLAATADTQADAAGPADRMRQAGRELRYAVGLEERESV